MSTIPKLITVGVIAAEAGVTIDKVARILRSHPHIKPSALAGNVRLFDHKALAQVRREIEAMRQRRRVGG